MTPKQYADETMNKNKTGAATLKVRCPACKGRGLMPVEPGSHLSVKVEDTDCKRCGGEGEISAGNDADHENEKRAAP